MKQRFNKVLCLTFVFALMSFAILNVSAAGDTLAFPGAEGGGKYSLGARGNDSIEVYHVTNLDASGEGSFVDAVSKPGRIIVFDVGGFIEVSGDIRIKSSNLTILGQTAPGDGITIVGGSVTLDAGVHDVIIRFIKVRPTDKNGGEFDGIGGRNNKNIIFDHISTSWCIDELLTLYAGNRDYENPGGEGNHLTAQYTLASESLRMSNHIKGAHGYGAIIGGTKATYINNLFAHHDSRSPRLDRQLEGTEVSNNIIYNWGQTNSAYGAEPYDANILTSKIPCSINWIGNYYKFGPSTRESLKYRIFDVQSPRADGDPKSQFYLSGNYVSGSTTITNDNKLGLNNAAGADLLNEPVDMGDYSYEPVSASEAYERVLSNVGSVLPKRDAIDARIINDVKYGTGRVINNASEVGGLIKPQKTVRQFVIQSEWLTENGLSGKNDNDIIESGKYAGYTVIEAYVNEFTAEQLKIPPTNPEIVVQSPAIASLENSIKGLSVDNSKWTVVKEGETVSYKASAFPVGNTQIVKCEIYDGNILISQFDSDRIDTELSLDAGTHYLTSRAYNNKDEATQSTTSIVYVTPTEEPGSYKTAEIGSCTYKGKGGASMDKNGVYTIFGSGKIMTEKESDSSTSAADSCEFMYKKVSGDFDITVRAEQIPKFENLQLNGLMVRASLDSNDMFAMIGDGWAKYGENVKIITRKFKNAAKSFEYFKNESGQDCDNEKAGYSAPKYMRIQRSGNSLIFSVSNSGKDWTDNGRLSQTVIFDSLPDTLYVGLATDTASGVSVKEYFSMAKFSRLTLNGVSDVEVKEGAVPFYDADFDSGEWYVPKGAEINDYSNHNINGNYGTILMNWSSEEAVRSFNPQSEGEINISADFCFEKYKSDSVNEKAGYRFSLKGEGSDGETKNLITSYAQMTHGFYINYIGEKDANGNENSIPDIAPDSNRTSEFNTWYKIMTSLDYTTGKGKITYFPYTEYNSLSGTYTLGDAIFEYEFEFDTTIMLSSISFQRLGGYRTYIDNVSVSMRELMYLDGGKLIVDRPFEDAELWIAEYNLDGSLKNSINYSINKGETKEFDIPSGEKSKAFLWNGNQEPLCGELRIN